MRKFKKRLVCSDYIVLAAGLIIGVLGYRIFSTNQQVEIILIISLGGFYFIWGIWHHFREGDLHVKIILEYLLIAVLAVVLLLSLILRI